MDTKKGRFSSINDIRKEMSEDEHVYDNRKRDDRVSRIRAKSAKTGPSASTGMSERIAIDDSTLDMSLGDVRTSDMSEGMSDDKVMTEATEMSEMSERTEMTGKNDSEEERTETSDMSERMTEKGEDMEEEKDGDDIEEKRTETSDMFVNEDGHDITDTDDDDLEELGKLVEDLRKLDEGPSDMEDGHDMAERDDMKDGHEDEKDDIEVDKDTADMDDIRVFDDGHGSEKDEVMSVMEEGHEDEDDIDDIAESISVEDVIDELMKEDEKPERAKGKFERYLDSESIFYLVIIFGLVISLMLNAFLIGVMI